jgi:hypothetical protein
MKDIFITMTKAKFTGRVSNKPDNAPIIFIRRFSLTYPVEVYSFEVSSTTAHIFKFLFSIIVLIYK